MRWKTPAVAGGAVVTGAVLYLWLALLSPFGYTPPDDLPPIDDARMHEVFVYGTLRYRPVRRLAMGAVGDTRPATLSGYARTRLDLEPAPGGRVHGLVIDVTPDELRRLDRYERLGIRYDRVRLRLDDGTPAWVYVRTDDD
jgi:gamma-glutamylcyclotransferase (GGCT)/AIG2-like uncharacterized protein YtfP